TELHTFWIGWSPAIQMREVTLRLPETGAAVFTLESANVRISALRSLLRRTVVPDVLTVAGIHLDIVRDSDGRISLRGMDPGTTGDPEALADWLLNQPRLRIRDTSIGWHDEISNYSAEFVNASVLLARQGDRLEFSGSAELAGAEPAVLRLRGSIDGNPLESGWNGLLAADSEGVPLSELLAALDHAGAATTGGSADISLRSRWLAGRLAGVEGSFAIKHNPAGMVAELAFDELAGNLALSRFDEERWGLALEGLSTITDGHHSPVSTLLLDWQSNDGEPVYVHATSPNLHLDVVVPLLLATGRLPVAAAARLENMSPGGALNDADITWLGDDGLSGQARLTGVSLAPGAGLPRLTGLSALLQLSTAGGALTFEDAAVEIQPADMLVAPLNINMLNGTVAWQQDEAAWKLFTRQLTGTVNSFDLAVTGDATFGTEGVGDVALAASLANGDAARLHELIPTGLLSERGERWVRNVLISGRMERTDILIRGPMEAFPFDNASGKFSALVQLRDAIVLYSRRWPRAEEASLDIVFEGRKVAATLGSGRIYDAEILDGTVSIEDLFTPKRMVSVTGNARLPASDAARIILNSPLKNGKAARVARVNVSDSVDLLLDLLLPLYPGGPREVLGQVQFDGNRLHSPGRNLTLEDVTGMVSFTRDDWYGEGIKALYEGYPVTVLANGGLDDPNYDVEFRMTGTSAASYVLQQVERRAAPIYRWLESNQLIDAIEGQLDWRASLVLPETTTGNVKHTRLQLESSLRGMDLKLPWPLGKRPDDPKPVTITTYFADDDPLRRTHISVGSEINLETVMRETGEGQSSLERLELIFGTDPPEYGTDPGITMRGQLGEMLLGDWLAFVQTTAGQPDEIRGEPLPVRFDIKTDTLRMLGQQFSNVAINGFRTGDGWSIAAAGDDIGGSISVPADLKAKPLRMELDHLQLQKPDDTPGPDIDPVNLPAFELTCNDFRFGDIEFGRAELSTSALPSGLRLNRMAFDNERFRLEATGEWTLVENVQLSNFEITLHGNELGPVMQRFGYGVAAIKGGETNLTIRAHWPGGPADFQLERLTGRLGLNITKGQFLDIEPGGGRLFGLLSVQSLGRRLSLDFADVFGKGFAFDAIEGNFELDGGNAYTSSLLMSGPAAKVDVSGRTGLANQDYDQTVVVTPQVSGTLPAAGALFGPVGVGVGAALYIGQKIFKSIPDAFDTLLKREYTITGSWESPEITRL
ncbi:MAG: TIGR02099 family protein, partial [Gammaproteobacteria bacterium]|nr:TIGR02099 family protein [Gammaproteobacteria bacterium]